MLSGVFFWIPMIIKVENILNIFRIKVLPNNNVAGKGQQASGELGYL